MIKSIVEVNSLIKKLFCLDFMRIKIFVSLKVESIDNYQFLLMVKENVIGLELNGHALNE